ncbi:hypothetical protein APHAL10511_008399 [Amanita phalloides]|nr:hypothetical protein APHAL10511_008399 [Amanita phalloides]
MTLFSDPQKTFAVITTGLVVIAIVHKWQRSKSLPLPPGPREVLSYSLLPKSYSFAQLEEFTQQYGPVFSLRQGFKTMIVVGRVQAAIDIMEKQGAATPDRPKNTPIGEILSGGMRTFLMPNGERLRKTRRALHAYLQPKKIVEYGPVLMARAKQHILSVLDDPSNHQQHAKLYTDSVIMFLMYGITPERYDDPYITAVNGCLQRLGENMTPGKWKVDTFPFLQYIPGYFDELRQGHAEELAVFGNLLRQVKERLARGEVVPDCFIRYMLENQEELELSDDEAAYLAGTMFGAGTAGSISVGVMAAASYPNAQRKVQEELDRVIGERAPTAADLNMLPQLNAYVLEILRWRPVTADASLFPHRTIKEIIWQNYRIPKDTTIIGSFWSIGKDPDFFPDPEKFDPQRWINKDGKIKDDLKSFSFGFGRRVCSGQHLANTSMLLNMALLLWTFTIKEDPSSPIDKMALESCFATLLLPFNVVFEPRAAKTADGIRELFNDYAL